MINVNIMFGTRPEAIKMIPVIIALKKRADIFNVKIIVTAQHREMLDQVLKIFSIKPDIDMNIMKYDQSLSDVCSEILLKSEKVFNETKPDIVLVHGDTTTTFASSVAAFYKKIAIGHIEAGLRTNNKYSPYPEEMNRHLTGVLADYHFAPTKNAKKNLLLENIAENKIFITGNTAIDSLKIISNEKEYKNEIFKSKFVLITAHRRENFGKPFENICYAISELAQKYPSINFWYPVHLNPNIKKNATNYLGNIKNILLTDPLDYFEFVFAMKNSYFIITDSGGIQEEATAFSKPVILLRNTTERPEAVTKGTTLLTGDNKEKIIKEASELIENNEYYKKRSKSEFPFGNGTASEKIADILSKIT